MTEQIEEFVGIYKDVYPEGFCEFLIEEFDRCEDLGITVNRKKNENIEKHLKDDEQLFATSMTYYPLKDFKFLDSDEKAPTLDVFFSGVQSCFDRYTETFTIIKDMGRIICNTMKLQKISPGGGYHVWHCEQGNGPHNSRRVLTYMLYLNSLGDGDGGETEFLYQKKRYKPEKNTLLLWPATYTHPHRGGLVLGNKYKYIITGWFVIDG